MILINELTTNLESLNYALTRLDQTIVCTNVQTFYPSFLLSFDFEFCP